MVTDLIERGRGSNHTLCSLTQSVRHKTLLSSCQNELHLLYGHCLYSLCSHTLKGLNKDNVRVLKYICGFLSNILKTSKINDPVSQLSQIWQIILVNSYENQFCRMPVWNHASSHPHCPAGLLSSSLGSCLICRPWWELCLALDQWT